MGIEHAAIIRHVSRNEYHSIDYKVMERAFAVHNALGKFLDEKVYQRELAYQCREAGMSVETEMPVTMSHNGFRKTFFADLVANQAVIYELKATTGFVPRHKSQLLNYLFMFNALCGKLLNFGMSSVEHEFVTTSLRLQDRMQCSWNTHGWENVNEEGRELLTLAKDLVADWGAFLDLDLYREAVISALGGESSVLRDISVTREGRDLGCVRVAVVAPDTAFVLSSVNRRPELYASHLMRLLMLTNLKRMQWINFDKHTITAHTLISQSSCPK